MDLDLWLGDRLVARTVSRERGRKVRIVYHDAVATEVGDEVPLLSCSLPTPGPSRPASARAFLEGLLPEGRALEAAAAQVRGVRLYAGAPETAADAVALLAEYGRECAGAVVAVPAGGSGPQEGSFQPLDDGQLGAIVSELPRRPLGTDLDRDIRMSLAGAQPKFLLARIENRWHEPLQGAPSTHILKPTVTWPHSAQNEALVIALARGVGLTDCAAWVEQMGDRPVLVAERYDRAIREGRILRLHQEDMCQAIGLRPVEKYAIGRPSGRMARVLREFSNAPRAETERLFRHVAYRVLVGDEDGHGKNYSLLLADGAVTLAPLYDSLCTLLYPDLTGKMAAKIGAQEGLAKVDRAALLVEARAMGLPEPDANATLDALTDGVRRSIDDLDDSLTVGWPSERVIEIIRSRLHRLESGEPLGSDQAKSPRRRQTVHEATRRRQPSALAKGSEVGPGQ